MICTRKEGEARTRPDPIEDGSEKLDEAEIVSVALHEQERASGGCEVRVAKLLGLSSRMERIAQEDQSPDRITVRDEHRCDATPHRSAAEDEAIGIPCVGRAQRLDGLSRGAEEHGHPIGRTPSFDAIGESRANGDSARFSEGPRDTGQRPLVDVPAGAVPEHGQQASKRARALGGRLDDEAFLGLHVGAKRRPRARGVTSAPSVARREKNLQGTGALFAGGRSETAPGPLRRGARDLRPGREMLGAPERTKRDLVRGKGRSMFVHVSIHRPKPDQEKFLIDALHRLGNAMLREQGLQQVHTLMDARTGVLVGLSLWDSKEDWEAAKPRMQALAKDSRFEEEWASGEALHLEAV